MADLNRNGHRDRMRKAYLGNRMENSSDHNLLELFLSGIIPRKDVKQLSYDLINCFGDLEGVFSAPPEKLMSVNGIGEKTAVEISLVWEINRRISINSNKSAVYLDEKEKIINYCQSALKFEKTERVLLVTLDNSYKIIKSYYLDRGTVNAVSIDMHTIVEKVILDNASAIVFAHNHPGGTCEPSLADLDFSVRLKSVLKPISVKVVENVVVGIDGAITIDDAVNI